MPDITITLVHGTGARGALWTREEQPLWQELGKRFGASAVVDRFDWSGDNTAFARITAGNELASHLEKLKSRFPETHQYVIAHSHGGNVALYAAERTPIYGVACLATPFFHATPRSLSIISSHAVVQALFGLGCVILYIIYLSAHSGWLTWLIGPLVVSVVANILGAFLVGGPMAVAANTATRLSDLATAKVPSSTRRFAVFRATGDEASLALASGQFIGWLTTKSFAFLTLDQRDILHRSPFRNFPLPAAYWWFLCLSLIMAVLGDAMASDWVFGPFTRFLGEAGLFCSLLSLVWTKTTIFDNLLLGTLFILLCVAAFIGMFLVGTVPPEDIGGRAARWSVGFGYFMAVSFYTEATPPGGPWQVIHFASRPDNASDFELAHSIYSRADVREKLIDWVEKHA